jgi:hypothetical protein
MDAYGPAAQGYRSLVEHVHTLHFCTDKHKPGCNPGYHLMHQQHQPASKSLTHTCTISRRSTTPTLARTQLTQSAAAAALMLCQLCSNSPPKSLMFTTAHCLAQLTRSAAAAALLLSQLCKLTCSSAVTAHAVVPQAISTKLMSQDQLLTKAQLVRSTVPYSSSPMTAPCSQDIRQKANGMI